MLRNPRALLLARNPRTLLLARITTQYIPQTTRNLSTRTGGASTCAAAVCPSRSVMAPPAFASNVAAGGVQAETCATQYGDVTTVSVVEWGGGGGWMSASLLDVSPARRRAMPAVLSSAAASADAIAPCRAPPLPSPALAAGNLPTHRLTALALHCSPLDMVKTRLQNQSALGPGGLRYTGPIGAAAQRGGCARVRARAFSAARVSLSLAHAPPADCFRKILAAEGVAGLYTGLKPNLLGVTPEKVRGGDGGSGVWRCRGGWLACSRSRVRRCRGG